MQTEVFMTLQTTTFTFAFLPSSRELRQEVRCNTSDKWSNHVNSMHLSVFQPGHPFQICGADHCFKGDITFVYPVISVNYHERGSFSCNGEVKLGRGLFNTPFLSCRIKLTLSTSSLYSVLTAKKVS